MVMITFHHVKQECLLHVVKCIIYNVYVYQEGPTNIVANMLGISTKNYCTVYTSTDGSLVRCAKLSQHQTCYF